MSLYRKKKPIRHEKTKLQATVLVVLLLQSGTKVVDTLV